VQGCQRNASESAKAGQRLGRSADAPDVPTLMLSCNDYNLPAFLSGTEAQQRGYPEI